MGRHINWGKSSKHKRKKGHYSDYFRYINGSIWKARKIVYYATHPKKCRACGSTHKVELHHMMYGQFGYETDDVLVCLCDYCHDEFHSKQRTKTDMIKETELFIKKKQAYIRKLKQMF